MGRGRHQIYPEERLYRGKRGGGKQPYGIFGDDVSRDQWKKTFDRGVLESDRDYARQVSRDQVDDKWKETQWDYGVQQDELARGDKDREEAIARIYNHLQAGGSADGLPPDLVAQSGLSAMEIQAIANNSAHQREQSDQKFAAEMAESQASTAAKYASASKTSSGSKGSSGSTKDKYQDKSSNYCRIKSRASDLDDVEEVQAYLDRMISLYEFTGGKTGISEEEAAEMFALDLGYDPEDLYDDTDDVPGGGVPQTYDEFVSATGFSGIMNPDDFEKHMGKSGGKQYKNYQEYLNAMYQKYK